MTRIISSSIANESFRLGDFYVSRFWRLFPSVLFTIVGCLLCSFLVHTPSVAFEVCKSALAAIFSGSNVYFFSVSGYFDAGANVKPLLHTWSLSLEEQFYLVWPPALVLFSSTFKSDRWQLFTAFTGAMCLTSLVLPMASGQSLSEGFSFFLLPTRLFEFGAGALIHVLDQCRSTYSPSHHCLSMSAQFQLTDDLKSKGRLSGFKKPVITEFCACAGLLLLIGSYITLPAASPVHFGIPAVVGTVLLISTPTAKTNTWVLGNGASRWLGRLAYAVYLVHWPIYVYSLYICKAMGIKLLENQIILFLMSLCLGLALHKSVESRFRLKRGARVPALSIATILTLTALAIAVSVSGIKTSGWSFRERTKRKSISKLYAVPQEPMFFEVRSKGLLASNARGLKMAIVGKGLRRSMAYRSNLSLTEFSTIVVGNSFALAMIDGFYKAHDAGDRPFLFNYRPGCPLRPREALRVSAKSENCRFVSENIWENVAKMAANSTVVIVNDWEANVFYRTTKTNASTEARAISGDVRSLGHVPVVLGAAPGVSNSGDFNACMDLLFVLEYWGLATESVRRRCDAIAVPRNDLLRGDASIRKAVEAGEADFLYASSVQYLCGGGRSGLGRLKCPSTVEVGGVRKGMYGRDGKHLSFYGAARHADLVRSTLETAVGKKG